MTSQAYIEKLNRLVKASKELANHYDIIYYHGVPLIISCSKIKNAVHISWERTGEQDVKRLGDELKMELRRLRNDGNNGK